MTYLLKTFLKLGYTLFKHVSTLFSKIKKNPLNNAETYDIIQLHCLLDVQTQFRKVF